MNWFKKFWDDPLTAIFGEEQPAEDKKEVKTYNDSQVKAGIMYVLQSLSQNDTRDNRDEYKDVFRSVRLKPKMTEDDIAEQMSIVLDKLLENDLITAEEFKNLKYDFLVAAMADIAINAIEQKDIGELAVQTIRFDQQLRRPHLEIVHRRAPDHE